jgi:hypothetical protein
MKLLPRHTDPLLARPRPGQYGLLVAAATVFDDHAADTTRNLLHAYGIRTTTATDQNQPGIWPRHRLHRLHILVFPEDVDHAYEILCRHIT